MLNLSAKIRTETGRKVKSLRKKGVLPAVIYGSKTKVISLELDSKVFEKIYKEAGESSLINLEIESQEKPELKEKTAKKEKQRTPVLIREIQKEPLSGKIIHVDFYKVSLTEEVTLSIPLVFEGEAPAVKELGGTFVKNISEIQIKALPESIPHEIRVDINNLRTFEDSILIKDLSIPEGVKVLTQAEEIVALVTPLEKVEEELEKPLEEKVEEVEKAGEKKPAEEEVQDTQSEQQKA